MLDLLIAVVFSAMIPIILKYAHKRALAEEVILSCNYMVASLVSLCFVLLEPKGWLNEIESSQMFLLILIGIVVGLLFYGAFYFYQKSVRDNGVSISIAVGKMGIVIPMFLSLVLWKEIPSPIQWLGIVLSLGAILLINVNKNSIKGSRIRISLILFFLIGGMGDFGNKFFEMTVGVDYSSLFLLVVFISAFVASMFETLKKASVDKLSVVYGMAVGIPNMLTAYFLIRALALMKAAVVFPLYSGGAIVISMIYSLIVLKEKLLKKEILAIGIILIALIMVQWSMNG